MKNALIIYLLLTVSNIFGQDYIVKPDGTKIMGNIISMKKNALLFKSQTGNIDEYKIDKLSVIHISDPNFEMTGVHLNNTNYKKDDNGIHIVMLDNPVEKNRTSSNSSTTNVNIQAEKSSSLSITTDDGSPKAKVILKCDNCAHSGTLTMESEDKLTKVEWHFDYKEGDAFPMAFNVDSGKTYKFRFKAGDKQSIEKKVAIKSGTNSINVFE